MSADFNAPRDDLVRMCRGEASIGDDGRTLFGHFLRFNSPTVIDSWEGKFREVIAPGALDRTLNNNAGKVKALFNHGMDPSIGDKPLGPIKTLRADDKGGYAEVRLSETSYNDDLIALLRDGALDGQSFRFSIPEGGDTWEYPTRGLPTRTINELRLYEFGPVTFPAYNATTAGVRAREEFSIWRGLPDETQAELFRIITATRSQSPAIGTDDEWPGTEDPKDSERPHSSVNQIRMRALYARAVLLGVINE